MKIIANTFSILGIVSWIPVFYIIRNYLQKNIISYISIIEMIFVFIIPFIFSYFALIMHKNIKTGKINIKAKSVSQKDFSAWTYLLSMSILSTFAFNNISLLIIFFVSFIYTCIFAVNLNPLFMLFGYHYFNIKTEDNILVTILMKNNIKQLNLDNLKKISPYTYIQI